VNELALFAGAGGGMTFHLTTEARYRLEERLGIRYEDRPVTPFDWENMAMAAMRWQRTNDKDSQRFPVEGPRTKILQAE
jgi:hypothetical protein